MGEYSTFTFEEIFRQNENRIHYQLHKLGIHDPHNEYYTEGLYGLWQAYKKYKPDKGPMATYFNYMIRYRLLDKIRYGETDSTKQENVTQEEKLNLDHGNHYGVHKYPVVDAAGLNVDDGTFWRRIREVLTTNQWKWVSLYIVHGMSQNEIAAHEQVSVEAVKSWAKQARKKLRKEEEQLR